MKTTIKIEGLKELEANLLMLPVSTARGVARRALLKAGEHIAEEARRLAPDDPTTGPPNDLKSSITVSATQKSGRQARKSRSGAEQVTRYVGPSPDGYPQAIPQEFGSRRHPAQPYMRPAFDSRAESALDILIAGTREELDKALARARKKAAKKG